MASIIISTNSSLDGVVQDPDGREGFERGNWFSPPGSPERDDWAEIETAEAMRAGALLLGRQSYQWFASRWAERDGAWAERLNGLPKFVVSSTLTGEDAGWGPTSILRNDLAEQVARVKREQDGEILVYASYQLGQRLLELDLVDQMRIFTFPVIIGAGRRLFGETSARRPLRLRESTVVGGGLVLSIYDVLRAP